MAMNIRLEVGDFSLMRELVVVDGADLMAFDPPYNVGKKYKEDGDGGDRMMEVEYRRMAFEVCRMGMEVARGRMAIVLSRKVLGVWVTALAMAGMDAQVVVVRKRAVGVLQSGMRCQWVPVVVTCAPVKRMMSDVWEDIRLPGEGYFFREDRCGGHPAITSVMLMERIVEGWTRVGELVVDPFVGSGATAVACWRLGREFVGVDREQRFVEGIVDRLAWETERRTV